MKSVELKAQPLSRAAFAPFGDVIETEGAEHFAINAGAIERFHDLATVDVGAEAGGRALISLVQSNVVNELPYELPCVERHSLGTQAFIPLDEAPLVVVVATPGESVDAGDLRAFASNGRQGVNYHRGVWHMPLIALRSGQRWLVVDRGGPGDNCDEYHFPDCRILVTA